MKKGRLLNSEISYVIGKMGHTDSITIGDCGLPVPDGVQRIDLAVAKGLPELIPVLTAVLDELFIERVILAQEIIESNPELNNKIIKIIKSIEKEEIRSIDVEYVAHKEFKKLTAGTKAVVRTGEYKSYANIILVSGVTF
ncbi:MULTISPECIES: D-ribose pyranase [unclassified Sedimentibacter]|uniref:D-ribose pyranase n=1 Tax=unclassified Sedimentibacter TaxID=2649220 RepID=UPI0027E00122|nr:D-ribose pyranase [Sedimentibacter sp. MB35-C1]WMJ78931.1 D-ribose pyranase [Sedimentibacter sp. MB35-C1]